MDSRGTHRTRSPEETQALGERLGGALRGGEVVLLCGDLGAGKTQFAKGVARAMGVAAEIVSPTFTIAARYAGRLPLVHYDLYRITRATELREIGFLESDDPREVALIEWGDRIAPPPGAWRVDLALEPDGTRRITVEPAAALHDGSESTRSLQDATRVARPSQDDSRAARPSQDASGLARPSQDASAVARPPRDASEPGGTGA